MEEFNRTIYGITNKYQFYSEPLIYVEGKEDIVFYSSLIDARKVRIEFLSGGKIKLYEVIEIIKDKNLPIIVIIDGDYDIIEKLCKDNKVIMLNKYSIENYLFNENLIIELFIERNLQNKVENILKDFNELRKELLYYMHIIVIMDYIKVSRGDENNIFPKSINCIMDEKIKNKIKIDPNKIKEICDKNIGHYKEEEIDKVRHKIQSFFNEKRFIDILRGHFVFSIIAKYLSINVSKFRCDTCSIYQLLSKYINRVEIKDINDLKCKIESAIIEVKKQINITNNLDSLPR